jgi:EmrB/QacA subfamily drug resistance transporter
VVTRQSSPRPSMAWTLAITSVAFFIISLGGLVVTTALPAIHRDFGANLATLGWIGVNAYGLAFAVGITTAAALGDRLGRVRIFGAGLGVFTAASTACAMAPSVGILIAGRAVEGIGAAILLPLSLTILTGAFPPERRGTVVGIWGGIGGLGVASGPLIGGALTQALSWHWVFWVNVPIGVLATILAFTRLTESRGPATRLDLTAVALVSGGAFGIVWGLVRGNDAGWTGPQIVTSLGAGVLLIAAFLFWERRAAEPMLPLRLFRNASFVAANATAFLLWASLISVSFFISQYFQFVHGNTPFEAGIRVLPWTAAPIVLSPAAGALSDLIGRRPVMVAGMLVQGIGLAWLASVAAIGVDYGHLVGPLILAGVGGSMVIPTAPAAALGAVSPGDIGKASGVTSTLLRFGSVAGVAIATAVFSSHGHLGTAASFDAGFRPAIVASAAFSTIGALFALAVVAGRRESAEAKAEDTHGVAVTR